MAIFLIYFLLVINIQIIWCMDTQNCTLVTNLFESARVIPSNPQVRYYLFTNKNTHEGQEIHVNDPKSLADSNFNNKLQTRFMIHGWKGELMSCVNAIVKEAYLKKGDFNVIIVDWSDWSKSSNYNELTNLVNGILGESIAKFTKFLTQAGKISHDQIYLIGHSLGAHIAGAAGQFIKPEQYNTIFALDAAGLTFQLNGPENRIDNTDAKYVESITTSMGTFGYIGELGHASFYPNYGQSQPHCKLSTNSMCNHVAAVKYFAESINSKIGFCSIKCTYLKILFRTCDLLTNNNSNDINSLGVYLMGGEPSIPKLGAFLLKTNDQEPFASEKCD